MSLSQVSSPSSSLSSATTGAPTLSLRPMSMPYDKAKPYRLFLTHAWKYRLTYIVGVVALLAGVMIETAVPKLIQWMLDALQIASASASQGVTAESDPAGMSKLPALFRTYQPTSVFNTLFMILVGLICVQWFARRYWRLTLGLETHHIGADFKSMIWERVRFFRSDRLSTQLTKGVLMNVATGDAGSARMMFGWVLAGLVDTTLVVTFSIIGMLTISPSIAVTVSSCLILVPFIGYGLGKIALRRYVVAQDALSELNELIAQSVSTTRLQRLSQTEKAWSEKVLGAAEAYRVRRLAEVYTFQRFILLFGIPPVIALVFLFWCGFDQLQQGQLSIGQFVALQSYAVMMIMPLGDIGFLIADWQKSRGSLERLCEVLREPVAEEVTMPEGAVHVFAGASDKDSGAAAVFEVKNLSFSYQSEGSDSKESRYTFKNVSFSLQKGERLGIYGAVGSGKSTLLSIVSGLRRGYSGEVLLHGADIQNYSPKVLRNSIAIVEQKPFLFADSVRNNIALSAENLSDEEILHYLEIAGLATDVRSFPRGLDTQLGEWGINLSGGQRQRLCLARALAAKPKILLLDDCLSAVDTVTEEAIIEALNYVMADVTMLWVAHRRSTLRYCNQLLRLPS
jgi:ATP-binding cassette, subfamily B, multidrug efflux pump